MFSHNRTLYNSYIPLPGGGALSSGGGNFYLHKDWLGSSRVASTIPATGNGSLTYDRAFAPFGEEHVNHGYASPPVFAEDTSDLVSGLFDTPNRELSIVGRWISPDPAGLGAADPMGPQSWNRYSYVENDPCNAIDPLGLCNFNIAITNHDTLTDAEAKSAWQEIERLFGLAGLGAMFTGQKQADFTLNIVFSSVNVPDYKYGTNDGWFGSLSNSATIYQQNTERDAAGMDKGVALGRDMFHEFAHWGLNLGPDGSNKELDGGIMSEGAKGTFDSAYAFLTTSQIDALKKRCNALHGGSGGGAGTGGGSGGLAFIPVYGIIGDGEEWGYSYSWNIGPVDWIVLQTGPHKK
jgi:RHS repeat-associated protein